MSTLPPGVEDTSAVGMHPTGMPSCYDTFSTCKYNPMQMQTDVSIPVRFKTVSTWR